MKKLITFLLCLTASLGWSLPIQSHHAAVARLRLAPSGSSTDYAPYLAAQGFEGTGYDNSETWSETGTPDEDYTTTALEGSQSLFVTSTDYAQFDLTDQDSVTICWQMRFTVAPGSYSPIITAVMDDFSSVAGQVFFVSNVPEVQSGGTTDAGSGTVTTGVTYYCKLELSKGTGPNSIAHYFQSTSTNWGAVNATVTTGNITGKTALLRLKSGGGSVIYDHIRIKAGAPGTVTDWPL